MQIHYFQRYSEKENAVTANVMLMFSRLYHHDIDKFYELLDALIEDPNDSVEVNFEVQHKGNGSVPDAVISNKSFSVIIETKLSDKFGMKQLQNHINSFRNEDIKVLLSLGTGSMDQNFREELEEYIKERNQKINGAPVRHINLTFAELVKQIDDVLDERDREMYEIFKDFDLYCHESELIPHFQNDMRAVTSGVTFDDNLKFGIVYESADRNVRKHGYVGLYKGKTVRAIGKLVKTAVATWNNGEIVFSEVLDSEYNKAELTDEEKARIRKAGESNTELQEETCRYFIVDKFYPTDFKKVTKNPILKDKFFDLTEVLDTNKLPQVDEIAQRLSQEHWG